MNSTAAIRKLNDDELRRGRTGKSSWHQDYRHSAYIYVGGLNFGLTEGDVAIVFSQYGEIVDLRLVRDKDTGKSRGFAFVCYEDQRSTVLAVDNLNGISLADRVIRVDHIAEYKIPKEVVEAGHLYTPSGPDGKGYGKWREFNEKDLKEVDKEEDAEAIRARKLERLEGGEGKGSKAVDEDERWEQQLMSGLGSKERGAGGEVRRLKKEYKKLKKEIRKKQKQ